MKLVCDFVINNVAGDNIAVPVGENSSFRGYIRINESGKDIFELLKEETDRQTVIQKLQEIYPGADLADLTESVDDVIGKLTSAGLLTSDT